MRSSWKPDYFSKALLRLSANLSKHKTLTNYKVYDKASTIPVFLQDQRVLLHNGKNFISFLVRDYHVGRKFSYFLTCKATGPDIHKKVTKKSKKNLKSKK